MGNVPSLFHVFQMPEIELGSLGFGSYIGIQSLYQTNYDLLFPVVLRRLHCKHDHGGFQFSLRSSLVHSAFDFNLSDA